MHQPQDLCRLTKLTRLSCRGQWCRVRYTAFPGLQGSQLQWRLSGAQAAAAAQAISLTDESCALTCTPCCLQAPRPYSSHSSLSGQRLSRRSSCSQSLCSRRWARRASELPAAQSWISRCALVCWLQPTNCLVLTRGACTLQDTFTDQVHELHRLVARQRRLCSVCDQPEALNAALQAEAARLAQPAQAPELPARKRRKVGSCSLWVHVSRAVSATEQRSSLLQLSSSARLLQLHEQPLLTCFSILQVGHPAAEQTGLLNGPASKPGAAVMQQAPPSFPAGQLRSASLGHLLSTSTAHTQPPSAPVGSSQPQLHGHVLAAHAQPDSSMRAAASQPVQPAPQPGLDLWRPQPASQEPAEPPEPAQVRSQLQSWRSCSALGTSGLAAAATCSPCG